MSEREIRVVQGDSPELRAKVERAREHARQNRKSRGYATAESREAAARWVRDRAMDCAQEAGQSAAEADRQVGAMLREGDAKERDRGRR